MDILYLYLPPDEACPAVEAAVAALGAEEEVTFRKLEMAEVTDALEHRFSHSPTLKVNGREADAAAEDLVQAIRLAAAAPLAAEEDWFLPDELIDYYGTKMKNCPGRTCPCDLCG